MEDVKRQLQDLVRRLEEIKEAHYGAGAEATEKTPYGFSEVVGICQEGFKLIADAWPITT